MRDAADETRDVAASAPEPSSADNRHHGRLHDVARHAWVVRDGGARHGERTLPTPGGSTMWFDARPYQEGDDLRYVDWRGYARSRRLHTRLHMAERGVDRSVFVDRSRSMVVAGKRAWSDAITDVLVRARGGDGPCAVHAFASPTAERSPGSLVEAWSDAWATSPAHRGRHAVVVVGDLLTEEPWAKAFRAVTARGSALMVVHVVAPSELTPTIGASTLRDVETGARFEVSPAEVEAYRTAARAFLVERRREAIRAGAGYARLVVPEPSHGVPLPVRAFAALVRSGVIARA